MSNLLRSIVFSLFANSVLFGYNCSMFSSLSVFQQNRTNLHTTSLKRVVCNCLMILNCIQAMTNVYPEKPGARLKKQCTSPKLFLLAQTPGCFAEASSTVLWQRFSSSPEVIHDPSLNPAPISITILRYCRSS